METALNLFCPACGAPIAPRLGCDSCCIQRAISLQLHRFGAELACVDCGQRSVVRLAQVSSNGRWLAADSPSNDGSRR